MQKIFVTVTLVIAIITNLKCQREVLNYQFANVGTNFTTVTQTKNIDTGTFTSFNIFHENDSLIRFLFQNNKLVKKLEYYVEMSSEKIEFANAIPFEDFYSIRENTFENNLSGKILSEYYLNRNDHDIYLMQTNIDNGILLKDKIAKLSKKENILVSYHFKDLFLILVTNSNDDYLRIIKIKNSKVLFDNKIENLNNTLPRAIAKKLLNTKNFQNYFLNLKVLDANVEYGLNTEDAQNKGYLVDSMLYLQLNSQSEETNILLINLIQNTVNFKTLDTKFHFTKEEFKTKNQSSTFTKNYLIKYNSLQNGNETKLCIDVYSKNENKLIQTFKLPMDYLYSDSMLYTNWDGENLVENKKVSITDNIYEFMAKPINVFGEETADGNLIVNLGYYKRVEINNKQAINIIASIASSLTFTYLLNSIPNVWGYGYLISGNNKSYNITEYKFSVECNFQNKTAKAFLPQNKLKSIQKELFKEVKKAKSRQLQFTTVQNSNQTLIGIIDNIKKQFKVFAIN